MNLTMNYHHIFYKLFKFKWRNPFITTSKILFRGSTPKRVLGILDFENGRAVIGDTIAFHEILLVIAEANKIDEIDIAFVNPRVRNYSKNIYQIMETHLIEDLISLNKVNPKLGSYYVFNNNSQFSKFFHSFRNMYIIFPNPIMPFSTVSNWHHVTEFYEKEHYIPELIIDSESVEYGKKFIEEHCDGKIPVVAAIRKNNRDEARNAPVLEWIKFFQYAEKRHNEYKFIIIGAKNEIIPELEEMDNIVFAKSYGSTLLQDIALITLCQLFIGNESGVVCYSWFTNKPTISFGMEKRHVHWGQAIRHNQKFNFLNGMQQVYWGKYTTDDVISSFENITKNLKL